MDVANEVRVPLVRECQCSATRWTTSICCLVKNNEA